MARIDTLGHFLTDVADAIREKTGSSDAIAAEDFDTEIENIPSGGGGTVEKKDVNFYDYDGTLVNSYSKSEFLELSTMPSNPTHSGLTSQGWNWSLSDAKTYVTDYGKLNIGQMYDTDDGSVRIHIKLEDGRLSPYLGFAINGTATINWGDNTETSTVTGTSTTTPVFTLHNYSQAGEYVIAISSESDIHVVGSSNGSYLLTANGSTTNDGRSTAYRKSIIRVDGTITIDSYAFQNCYSLSSVTIPTGMAIIGLNSFYNCYSLLSITIPSSNRVTIDNNCFQNCYSLSSVTIPIGINNMLDNTFNNCYRLSEVTIPSSVTKIYNYVFQNCRILSNITIPSNISSIGSSAFNGCVSLTSTTIPSSVTNISGSAFYGSGLCKVIMLDGTITIGSNAFGSCSSVAYYDFSNHTSIPTLSNTNAFGSLPSDCKIIVPDNLYNDWIAASNWSTYASYIIKKSDWDNL